MTGLKTIAIAATLTAFVATPGTAQIEQQLPPGALERAPIDRRLPEPVLNLPEFTGKGTVAATLWLTPVLVAAKYRGDPPQPRGEDDTAPADPVIPIPTPLPGSPIPRPPLPGLPDLVPPNIPSGGSARLSDYSGPGPLVLSISVINPDRRATAEVATQCFTRDGVRIPSLNRIDRVARLSMLSWRPTIFVGDTSENVASREAIWCVISSSLPVTAHAQTQNYDYVDFFVGAH